MKYQSMSEAPKNRSIVAKLRDGSELQVKWDKRSGPARNSYLGTAEPGMVEGWCTRDNEKNLLSCELIGWREIDDE